MAEGNTSHYIRYGAAAAMPMKRRWHAAARERGA